MSRRVVPLAVLVAAVLGCEGKKPAAGGGGGEPPAPGGGDAAATYAVKLREKQAGEKYEVTESGSTTTTTTADLPAGKQTKADTRTYRAEYTEAVLEQPAGAAQPTKLTRQYRVAERTGDKGKPVAASFVGKTVTVEKKGEAYTFKADGKDLPPAE